MLLASLLVLIAALIVTLQSRLAEVRLADSTTGQWAVNQAEIEALHLKSAISDTMSGRAPDAEVRRWFDVLYSRVSLLISSPIYAPFLANGRNAADMEQLRGFADRWLPIMDGPDAALITALPRLYDETIAAHQTARNLSMAALVSYAAAKDTTRAALSETLILLGIAIGASLLLLVVLALILLRLSRVARFQADQHAITGARLQMIIATSPDAIVVTNRGGWVVEFNPAAEAMFGVTRAAVLGRIGTKIIFADQDIAAYQALISAALGRVVTLGPQSLELEGRRADGSRFPLEVSLAIRDLKPGALAVAFLRDISARRARNAALQTALHDAQAGEQAKARFIAVMSHEMRTPLNGLLGSMDLMRDTALSSEQAELLRVMQVSGEGLLGHVNSVLDVTLAEAGDVQGGPAPFDLDQLVADCLASQAGPARSVGITLTHAPLTGALGRVQGDAGRLRQVLLNLVGNALKFTPTGSITLETEHLPGTAAEVEFRVVDTGIGIAPSDQARVFEDFEMADASLGRAAGGSGLGLGIVRRLVAGMGGQIGLESMPGEGSVFWVRLPLPRSEGPRTGPDAAIPAPPDRPHPTTPLSVLIVEDNDINRFLLRRYLEGAGHRVTEAVDGVDGVAQAAGQTFDLIVTDLAMPRLDGMAAARMIRAQGASRQARIVALTAQVRPDELAHLAHAGIDAWLTKPVTRDQVLGLMGPPVATALAASDVTAQGASLPEAILDPSALAEMRRVLQPTVLAGLIHRLMHEGDRVVAEVLAALDPGAPEARKAHQLAGTSATFGTARLRQVLTGLETALLEDDPTAACALLGDLRGVWTQTRAALETEARLNAA